MDDRSRRRLEPLSPGQLAGVLLAILALAVVIVSASRPGEAGPAAPPSSLETRAAVVRALPILLAIGEAALIALIVWAWRPGGRRAPVQGRRRRSLALAIVASFLQTAAAVLFVWYYLRQAAGGPGGRLFGNLGRPPNTIAVPGALPAGPLWLTILLVVVVLAIASGFVLRGVRLGRRRSPPANLAELLVEAVEEGLEELEADTDPRRAVIAAYARMELALARVGLPRAPHEAALEYLDRLLGLLDARGPAARRLTELFQVAKFSDHVVDRQMQLAAILALAELRDHLRVRAAARGTEARGVPA
ncbi:MAG: DUF4129 domain-containing protein [Candidatus Dormibacteraeota bacterium]|nr:DUF4129 domain-containing protein [Candidatus Dormibacteraeota bacterium]